jgi:hypothetical protein
MRYYLILLLFLSQASVLFSQFTDNFTDGNFTAAPAIPMMMERLIFYCQMERFQINLLIRATFISLY